MSARTCTVETPIMNFRGKERGSDWIVGVTIDCTVGMRVPTTPRPRVRIKRYMGNGDRGERADRETGIGS